MSTIRQIRNCELWFQVQILEENTVNKSQKEYAFTKHFHLPRCLVDRKNYILKHCSDKKVLHVGCIDYASSTNLEEVISSERWLHKAIESVAGEVVGVDNAADTITLLKERFGYKKIFLADAQNLRNLGKGRFDVIVAGEVIEHMPNPGLFFESAHSVINPGGFIIVTTINAYCARRFIRIPFGKESIHPDHVAYYSHRTLQHLVEMSGYVVTEQCSYKIPNRKPFLPYVVEQLVCFISPNLGEGIICKVEETKAQGRTDN